MSKLEDAIKLMEGSGEEILSLEPASEERIVEAEKALGVSFPPSYRRFLAAYGCLSFEAEDFYGVTDDGEKANAVPSVIFATKSLRGRGDASPAMVFIKTSGYGPNFCIDTSEQDESGESPVYEVPLSFKRDGIKNKMADSFADFFYSEIKAAIDNF